MKNIFLSSRKYYDAGLSIIPLLESDKIPFIESWSDYCRTIANDETIDLWEKKYPNSNIGLCLGPASGVVAFDFDWDGQHKEIIENLILGHLPIMPVRKKGNKGWTSFFKYSGQKNRSCSVKVNGKNKTVFDFLSDGKQTVMPPSVHPNGSKYIWLTEDTLEDFELDNLPTITDEEVSDLVEFIKNNFDKLQDMSDSSVISAEPRHNQIFKHICNLSKKIRTEEEIINSIYEFDQFRFKSNSPGWDGKPTAYFYDTKYHKGKSIGILAAEKLVKRVLKWLSNSESKLGRTFSLGEEPKPVLQEKDYTFYSMYCSVFNSIYPNAFVCRLTGDVIDVTDGKKRYILNEERIIKAECLIRGLKKTDTLEYFDKWISELPRKLNFDLPEWDGKDHIKEVFSHVLISNIDQEKAIDLIKEWFSGIFRRLEDNNFQNRLLLFEGPQGVGKDTLIYNLFNAFGEYFSNIELTHNEKDSYDKMARNIVINISEFDRSAKISSAQIKNMITSPSTLYRKPYARASTLANFHCSFVSSCNLKDVLRDETGNRRFLFFNVQSIDWEYPKGISGQILAQAKRLSEMKYKASDDSAGAMKQFLDVMTPESMDSMIIEEYNLRMTRFSIYNNKSEFTYSEISEILLSIKHDFGVYSLRKILMLLKINGYTKHTKLGRVYNFTFLDETFSKKDRSPLYYTNH